MKKFLIILVLIIAVLVVGRNIIVKFAIEQGAKIVVGVPLKIEKLDLGASHVGITGLNVYNPKGFPREVMFHSPEIFVEYNLGALLKGKVHVEDIRLDLDQFVIVTNEEGVTNLEALKPEDNKEGEAKEAEKGSSGDKKGPEIQIDHLALKIGTVIMKDYSKGGEPKVTEYKINISEEINDATNPGVIAGLIMMKISAKTGLSALGNLGGGVIDGAFGVSDGAVDTLKGTTDALKNVLKLPFGNK